MFQSNNFSLISQISISHRTECRINLLLVFFQVYPYSVLKTTNYKMPKDIDKSQLEVRYLTVLLALLHLYYWTTLLAMIRANADVEANVPVQLIRNLDDKFKVLLKTRAPKLSFQSS